MLHKEVCNLSDLVEETMNMFTNDCAKKDIALSLHMNLPHSSSNKVNVSLFFLVAIVYANQ